MIASTKDTYPANVKEAAGGDALGAFALYKEVMEELKTVRADDLRDQFAMAALQGLLIRHQIGWRHIDYAQEAYQMADAMIKEKGSK